LEEKFRKIKKKNIKFLESSHQGVDWVGTLAPPRQRVEITPDEMGWKYGFLSIWTFLQFPKTIVLEIYSDFALNLFDKKIGFY